MQNKKNTPQNSPNRNKQDKQLDKFEWKRAGKTSLLWILIIIGAIYISGQLTESGKNEVEIEYTEYREFLKAGDIESAEIIGNVFHGKFNIPQTVTAPLGPMENIIYFKLTLPFVDRENTEEWDSAGLKYTFKEKKIDWTGYLLNMLPWILLIGFWFFMIRRMQGGAGGVGGIFKFGKSKKF